MVSAAAVAASPARARVDVCMVARCASVTSRSSFHWRFHFEAVMVIQSIKFAAQVEMPRRGNSSFSSEPSDSNNQAIAATVWLTPPSNLEFPVFLSAHGRSLPERAAAASGSPRQSEEALHHPACHCVSLLDAARSCFKRGEVWRSRFRPLQARCRSQASL